MDVEKLVSLVRFLELPELFILRGGYYHHVSKREAVFWLTLIFCGFVLFFLTILYWYLVELRKKTIKQRKMIENFFWFNVIFFPFIALIGSNWYDAFDYPPLYYTCVILVSLILSALCVYRQIKKNDEK